jgi:hypothetical protein
MSDKDNVVEVKFFDDGDNVSTKSGHGPVFTFEPRFSVTGEIDGNHRVLLRKVGDLGIPVCTVAAPAMNEDKGLLATTVDLIG